MSYPEFAQAAPHLAQYGVHVADPWEVFNSELDENGGGFVLFDEFCAWATQQSLDVIKNEEETAVLGGQKVELKNHKKRSKRVNVDLAALSGLQIDFEDLARKMPTGMSPQDKQARVALWKRIDENGSGKLSLAEVDKAIRDVLKEPQLFRLCKPVFIRAFYAAKKAGNKRAREADRNLHFVLFREFRLLLEYLQLYFRLFYVFSAIDANMDGRIGLDEMLDAGEMLRVIGLMPEGENPRSLFHKMDADGKGMILFKEMSDYLITHKISVAVGPGVKKANQANLESRRELVQANR
jgi:Ca2+-binding EF-hand superfamily protein